MKKITEVLPVITHSLKLKKRTCARRRRNCRDKPEQVQKKKKKKCNGNVKKVFRRILTHFPVNTFLFVKVLISQKLNPAT